MGGFHGGPHYRDKHNHDNVLWGRHKHLRMGSWGHCGASIIQHCHGNLYAAPSCWADHRRERQHAVHRLWVGNGHCEHGVGHWRRLWRSYHLKCAVRHRLLSSCLHGRVRRLPRGLVLDGSRHNVVHALRGGHLLCGHGLDYSLRDGLHCGQLLPRGRIRSDGVPNHGGLFLSRELSKAYTVHRGVLLRVGLEPQRRDGRLHAGLLLPQRVDHRHRHDLPRGVLLRQRHRCARGLPRGLLHGHGQLRRGLLQRLPHDVHGPCRVQPLRGGRLLQRQCRRFHGNNVPDWLLLPLWLGRALPLPRGHLRQHNGALRCHLLGRLRCGLLRGHGEHVCHGQALPRGPVLRGSWRNCGGCLHGGLLLPRWLECRHRLPRGHVPKHRVLIFQGLLHRMRGGHVLHSRGLHLVRCMHGWQFLRGGRVGAYAVPHWLLLPRKHGNGYGDPLRCGKVWEHNGPHCCHVHGHVRSGLLHSNGQHVGDG